MATNKPFLSDIKTIRQRAREHIEKGAVTHGYAADRGTHIEQEEGVSHRVDDPSDGDKRAAAADHHPWPELID